MSKVRFWMLWVAILPVAMLSFAAAQSSHPSASTHTAKPPAAPANSAVTDALLARLFSDTDPAEVKGVETPAGKAALAEIDTLSRLQKQRLIPGLLKELGNQDYSRCDIAQVALGKVWPASEPSLLQIMKNPSDPRQENAIMTIEMMGAKAGDKAAELVPVLLAIVADRSDANKNTRWAAGNTLDALGKAAQAVVPASAIPPLVEELNSSDPSFAYYMLGALGPAAAPAIPALWDLYRHKNKNDAGLALSRIGAPVVPMMRMVLRGSDNAAKKNAIEVLGYIGPAAAPAVPDIIQVMADRDLLNAALAAFVRIGPGAVAAVPSLIFLLQDDDQRRGAIVALGAIGSGAKDAVPYLIDILQGKPGFTHAPPPPGWVYVHGESVGKFGRELFNSFEQISADMALKSIGTPEALAAVKVYDDQHPVNK